MILVILLSVILLPSSEAKKESLAVRNEVPGFELAADILGDGINKSLLWKYSIYVLLREILSIAERESCVDFTRLPRQVWMAVFVAS